MLDHEGERRWNGEPAIYRTLENAEIVVSELGLGRTSVICSMLYDIVQKKHISIKEVESMFGPKVTLIIEGLVKVTEIYEKNPTLHTENFRKLLLSFADDVRVVLIILADRLFQLRNVEGKKKEEQITTTTHITYIKQKWMVTIARIIPLTTTTKTRAYLKIIQTAYQPKKNINKTTTRANSKNLPTLKDLLTRKILQKENFACNFV